MHLTDAELFELDGQIDERLMHARQYGVPDRQADLWHRALRELKLRRDADRMPHQPRVEEEEIG